MRVQKEEPHACPERSANVPFGTHAVSNSAVKASFCVVFGPRFAKKLVTPDNIWPIVPWLNFTRRKAWKSWGGGELGLGERWGGGEVLNSSCTSAWKTSSQHVRSSLRSCDGAAPLCSVRRKSEPPSTSCTWPCPEGLLGFSWQMKLCCVATAASGGCQGQHRQGGLSPGGPPPKAGGRSGPEHVDLGEYPQRPKGTGTIWAPILTLFWTGSTVYSLPWGQGCREQCGLRARAQPLRWAPSCVTLGQFLDISVPQFLPR